MAITIDERPLAAVNTLASGIDASTTSITLDDASSFPNPSVGYNCVIWDPTSSDPAADPNFEVVRVTAVSGNVLTVVRGQEGTSGATHSAGDQIFAGPTSKIFTDIRDHTLAAGEFESVTISSGVLTLPGNNSRAIGVNAETGTSDILVTISGGLGNGQILFLAPATGDTITVDHLAGNINLIIQGGDYTLDTSGQILMLMESGGTYFQLNDPAHSAP